MFVRMLLIGTEGRVSIVLIVCHTQLCLITDFHATLENLA